MAAFSRSPQTEVRPKLLCTRDQVGGGTEAAFPDLERVVNGWTLEFNLHCSFNALRAGQHEQFCAILNVITAILNRPYVDTDEIGKKLLAIQFLSKFENDAISLESVLTILDQMKAEFSLSEDLFQEVRGAVVQQAVVESIKKNCFLEASQILERHFKEGSVDEKLLSAVREKNSSHLDLHLFSYSNLKGKMLLFAESLIDHSEPFLLLSAKTSISRSAEVHDEELRMDCSQEVHQERQASEWNKSTSNPIDKCCICSNRMEIQPGHPNSYVALQTAFCILHKLEADPLTAFKEIDVLDFELVGNSKLQTMTRHKKQTVEENAIQRSDKPAAKCIQAVSRFITDPDSQDEVECLDTVNKSENRLGFHQDNVKSIQTRERDGSLKEISPKETTLRRGKWCNQVNYPGGIEGKEEWSDEEFLFDVPKKISIRNGRTSPTESNFSCSSKRQKWTVEESEWIKLGVKKFGLGNWQKILKHYPFCDRTGIMIKDRWRTMQKLGMT
ncbi:telomeric repeat-binding factor 2-like isoform X1 [Chiloscyllium plagiosum]|uniref:telomeric repeat-binding factor 2-like isoform X1 n=1 Tax=Chiloscyllium plagiosum TaxID=36176 RepID=UPI001CB83832|nr:telomeric repeat-binding factor 2-like isoform X1 [Chiloscyllium plagiosum]